MTDELTYLEEHSPGWVLETLELAEQVSREEQE